jgi:hypothetical protein
VLESGGGGWPNMPRTPPEWQPEVDPSRVHPGSSDVLDLLHGRARDLGAIAPVYSRTPTSVVLSGLLTRSFNLCLRRAGPAPSILREGSVRGEASPTVSGVSKLACVDVDEWRRVRLR